MGWSHLGQGGEMNWGGSCAHAFAHARTWSRPHAPTSATETIQSLPPFRGEVRWGVGGIELSPEIVVWVGVGLLGAALVVVRCVAPPS